MKGTVTPLSEALPLHQIAKAAQHIKDAIRERSDQQEELKAFAEDNKALQKLVQELPNKVFYKIMVPFGKAAFFPGQLVHTNELMVLLGEGYYAEQSAKQTVEILKRRGKYLESKIEALQTQISNLQTEASFANDAAIEAAAGFVEIREDYAEPTTVPPLHEEPTVSQGENDEAHERIMAALADLEAQEAAFEARQEAEDNAVDDASEEDRGFSFLEDRTETTITDGPSSSSAQGPPVLRSPADFLKFEEWKKRSWEREHSQKKETNPTKPRKKVSFAMPDAKERIARKPDTAGGVQEHLNERRNKAFTGSVSERTAPDFSRDKAFIGSVVEHAAGFARDKAIVGQLSPHSNRDKAFTGSIVEQPVSALNTEQRTTDAREDKASLVEHSRTDTPIVLEKKDEPSKPVSRFRMRRQQ